MAQHDDSESDLGFEYRQSKDHSLFISHHGRVVTTLRNKAALKAIDQLENAGFHQQQQLMARLTGHYKHGNERPITK